MKGLTSDAILYYIDNPVDFVEDIIGAKPDVNQKAILNSLAKYPMTSVRSGHGIGKSAVEAWAVIWFICTRPYPKIPCTAPTQHQLYDILWAEISKWLRSNPALQREITWTQERVYMNGAKEEWFAVARTANTPDALQGFHSESMLFIIDEASGVDDEVFEPVLGALSTEGARLLMCGNPTQLTGFFYDSHHKNRTQYHTIHVDDRDSPRVSKEYIERIRTMYGEDSDVFRVRVAGDFPKQEKDVFIPLSVIEKSMATDWQEPTEQPTVHIGCDVARFGDDKTIIGYKVNEKVFFHQKIRGQDTVRTAHEIALLGCSLVDKYHLETAIPVKIDDGGVGGGVTDRLREIKRGDPDRFWWLSVIPVKFGERMRTAVKKFASDGLDAQTALQNTITEIANMKDSSEATTEAVEIFGSKVGVDFARAIRDGAITTDTLTGSLDAAVGTLEKTAEAGESLSEKWEKSNNKMNVAFTQVLEPAIHDTSAELADLWGQVGDFLTEHPNVVKALTAIGTGLGTVAVGVAGLSAAMSAAKVIQAGFFAPLVPYLPALLGVAAGVTAITAAVTMLGNKYEDTYKETQSMTAVTAEQQKELESLEEQYQIACDTYGDTSDQASSLKYRIDTLSESLNSNGQSVGDLISECDNLIDKHNSLMDELDNNTESVHKNELENLALIARLSELASSTGEAAGKQQEMQAILDELNGNIDGLNMTYEDLTENQDKSLAYIKQMAQEQAKQEAYNEKYQEYVDLIKQQAQEQGELAKVQDEVTAAQQRANDAQKVYQDYIADLYAQDPTGMSTISAQWSEQAANADAAADALQEVLDKQAKLQDAYDETGKKIEEIEEGYTAAADAAKAAAEEGATYGEAISQAYSDVRSDVEKLCQAYDDAYQAAKDSFEGQFDLFDQASTKSSDYLNASVSNAQAALDSQLNYWNTYTANIETLKATSADDLGITEENYKALMSYVQDGSEQAAGLAASMVQSINSGNKDAVAKLADTLADVTAKQDAAAQATADWVTNYENQLDDFQKKMEGTVDSLDLSDEAGKAAKDTIAEYVQKLKDGKKDAVAAAKDVAASVALALQNGSTPSVPTSTTTTVPGHAGGTTDAEDVFVAGENGPELIVGKQGSTVFPTEETDKIIDALNGMEPASDTLNEKKFDQFLQALTGVTVDAPEPGPGESLFDSVLGKVADIVSGKNSDLEAINAAYTGLPEVSTVALPASNAPVAAEAAPLNVQPNAQTAAQESTDATKEITKRIILEIVGNGSVTVSGGSGDGMSEKAVLELLTNNIKPVLMGVIKDEIFEEGQLSYDY